MSDKKMPEGFIPDSEFEVDPQAAALGLTTLIPAEVAAQQIAPLEWEKSVLAQHTPIEYEEFKKQNPEAVQNMYPNNMLPNELNQQIKDAQLMQTIENAAGFAGTVGKVARPMASEAVLAAKGLSNANAATKLKALQPLGGNNVIVQPTAQQAIQRQSGFGKVMGPGGQAIKPFAEGGFISDAEFASSNPDFIGEDDFESAADYYGSPSQQAITAVEGAAEGVVGPLAPLVQTKVLGMDEKDIRARREENPITHGVGVGTGLVGSTLAGVGLGTAMIKAGALAKGAVGITKALQASEAANAATAPLRLRVAAEAVDQAAQMAIMTGSDEVSKMVLNDPDTTAQSAIANVGLSSILGAGGGALFAGVVNPLWKATAGTKVDKLLSDVSQHLHGTGPILPESIAKAEADLGITLAPEIKGALSTQYGGRGATYFNELREAQNPSVIKAIDQHRKDISDAVLRELKTSPEDIANYSENQAGHDLIDVLKKEYSEKYAKVQEAYDKLKVDNAGVHIPDEELLSQFGRIIERGQNFGASGSPQQKIFDTYADRLLSQGTIGKVDQLITELNNEKTKAWRAGDLNTYGALKEIKDNIQDFADRQIAKQAKLTEKMGIEGAVEHGAELIAARDSARAEYARVSRITDRLAQEMSLGDARGAKQLLSKMAEKKSPEQILKSLSPKGNADLITFMAEHFPQSLEKIRDNELKSLVRPAILGAKGEEAINLKTLSNAVEKQMAGHNEYANFVLPPNAINKISSARTLMEALPNFKSSGTAGWHQKLNRFMPPSAIAAVGMLAGNHPVTSILSGIVAGQMGGKTVPEAVKLGLLKFIASDQPIKSEGFKSMVDYVAATYKAENILGKATQNVFKRGAQVLLASQIPSTKDLEKLDKQITRLEAAPNAMFKTAQGDLGHYLPGHQTAMSQTATNAALYLQSIKPKPFQTGPLDRPIEPSAEQKARYNRALAIAQQPLLVLERAKTGTITPNDIKDLQSMYPALYRQMSQKLTNAMISTASQEEPISYQTRMGVSLFLGAPLDSTMTPGAILSAQAANQGAAQRSAQPQMQGQQAQPKKGNLSKLGKTPETYMTPSQASAAHRAEKR